MYNNQMTTYVQLKPMHISWLFVKTLPLYRLNPLVFLCKYKNVARRRIALNLHCRLVSLFARVDIRAEEEEDFLRIDLSGNCRV